MTTIQRLKPAALLTAALLWFTGAPGLAQPDRSAVLQVSPDRSSASVAVSGTGVSGFHPSRVIVRFRAGASALAGSGRAVALSHVRNVHLIDTPPGLSVRQAVARYRQDPNVVYAEPDYTVSVVATPTDPGWANQWDMVKISAPQAWDVHTSSGNVVVAVVDTGIDFTHPDLGANLYKGSDGARGYTCMNGACVAGGADDHGHGTHVAGTIGAAMNNGVGIAGLNASVKLLSIKFLNSGGSGSISDAVLGFEKLAALKASGVPIRVTNNSWGGGGYSQALKDAMLALETGSPGTLNVCAAGNSGVNADFTPMYPAAYDNRGIVSVLATDSNDAGAYFTNYGLASVDIAAPGVGIYSTSPSGTCSLCDPSGYKSLSGTSMASPHVAGVAAALLDRYPNLTAAQARDVLLHPDSHDAMTNATARSTSTGGRLNFYKAISNAILSNPYTRPLNAFPTVTLGPDLFTTAGGAVSFTPTISDPDGDVLRTSTGRGPITSWSGWLFEWGIKRQFPAATPFNAPSVARTAAVPYDTAVADNRGGGASGRNWAVVSAAPGAGGAPTISLSVPPSAAVDTIVPITVTANDPEGQPLAWDLWAASQGGASGICCYQSASGAAASASMRFSSAGVYRVSVQAIDPELNTSADASAVISVGGATGTPPIVAATLDKLSGPVPLTVNVDMSSTYDPDGTISHYFIGCGGGFAVGSNSPKGSCRFDQPGTYWLLLQVLDNAGLMGLTSRYVVAHPASGTPPTDTTAPTVSITSPAAGASITGTVTLQASASDNTGVKEVEYYLDNLTASLGVTTTAPYSLSWNPTGVAAGAHTLYAVARDAAGNASTAASVAVNVVTFVAPTVTLKASSLALAQKATMTFSATTNRPTYGIARVDFLLNSSVICSDTTASYSCKWRAPAAPGTFQAKARAYDTRGNMAESNVLTLTVK